MSNFEIRFALPWLLPLLIPAVGAVVWSYARVRGARRRGVELMLPMALRICAVALLVLILSGFSVMTNRADTSLLILADRSDSMANAMADVQARVQEIARGAPRDMSVGVLSFAGDHSLDQPLAGNPGNIALDGPLNASATNIMGALDAAGELLPENTLRRVVLLTDGLETDGDALAAAAALANQGIRVDALQFDTAITTPEVEVTALHLPSDAALGRPFQAVVTAASNADTSGTLRLYEEDTLVREETVPILPGENAYTYSVTPTGSGIRVVSATLEPDADTLAQNNRIFGSLTVTSGNAILIIDDSGEDGRALQALLSETGYQVSRSVSQQLPRTISSLCQYGLVILMNVDYNALPAGGAALLEQYVRVYGRSVLTTGGENTYVFGNMKETPFEEFLPILMEVEEVESAEPIALLLLLDNSASMEGPAIVMARHGAIKSIESLNANDYVGVIAFSTDFEVLSELTLMENKNEVIAAVSGLGTMMGTVYGGALQEAYNQLTAFDATRKKHVILMSDGNPSDAGFEAIIERMAAQGITTSTIAVGNSVSAARLEKLAALGGGNFYRAANTYELPSIMMTDTIRQRVEYRREGAFAPTIGKRLFALPDEAAMPPVHGYLRASAKSAADVVLYAEKNRPLHVQWAYGTGMAASFLSDLSGRWTSGWFETDEGRRMIVGMVESLLADEHRSAAIAVTLQSGGVECTLRVQSADALEGETFAADVVLPDGSLHSVVLMPVGGGVFERAIPMAGFGKYGITLYQYDAFGALVGTLETAAAVSWSAEYEAFTKPEKLETLRAICEATGGAVLDSVEALLAVELDAMFITRDPTLPMAIACSALMLADIAVRKVKPGRVARALRKALRRR